MKKYFSIQGRMGRSRYVLSSIFLDAGTVLAFYATFLPIAWLIYAPNKTSMQWTGYLVWLLVAGFVSFVCAWLGVVVRIRRLHDLGRSGWDFLLIGIPFYNLWLAVQLWFFNSVLVRGAYKQAHIAFLILGALFWLYGTFRLIFWSW